MPLCDEFVMYCQNFDFKILKKGPSKKFPIGVATMSR